MLITDELLGHHNGGFVLLSQVFLADSSRLADKIRLLP